MGQFARRRQQGAGRQAAVQNRLHHRQAQTLLQRQGRLIGQRKQAFPLGIFGALALGHGANQYREGASGGQQASRRACEGLGQRQYRAGLPDKRIWL